MLVRKPPVGSDRDEYSYSSGKNAHGATRLLSVSWSGEACVYTARAHQALLVKVRQEKQTDYIVLTSRKEVASKESREILGMFPNVQKHQISRWRQIRRQVCLQITLMKRKIQQLLQSTSRQMMNASCNYERFSRMTRPISA